MGHIDAKERARERQHQSCSVFNGVLPLWCAVCMCVWFANEARLECNIRALLSYRIYRNHLWKQQQQMVWVVRLSTTAISIERKWSTTTTRPKHMQEPSETIGQNHPQTPIQNQKYNWTLSAWCTLPHMLKSEHRRPRCLLWKLLLLKKCRGFRDLTAVTYAAWTKHLHHLASTIFLPFLTLHSLPPLTTITKSLIPVQESVLISKAHTRKTQTKSKIKMEQQYTLTTRTRSEYIVIPFLLHSNFGSNQVVHPHRKKF